MDNPIIEKLRKLINMERSARDIGSIAEAEAFATKVQELMDAHKLSMNEISFETREQEEPIEWEYIQRDGGQKILWQRHIAMGIAKANTCECVGAGRRSPSPNSFSFVGRKSDREMCKLLFEYMLDLAVEMCEKNAKQSVDAQRELFDVEQRFGYHRSSFGAWMRSFRASWYAGFAQAIYARYIELYKATKVKYEGTVGLVHINNDEKLVRQSVFAGGGRNSASRKYSVRNEDAFAAGKSAGNSVSLSSNRLASSGRGSRLLGA